MKTSESVNHITRGMKGKTSIHLGVVNTASPLFIDVEGATIEAPKRCASYTPADGDSIIVLTLNDVFIVVDKVV